MKRYKLLKDTPTVKAGTIFEERESPDDYKELGQVVTDGCLTGPWLTVSEINNFDAWFEEIPMFERWRAAYGGTYAYISDDGSLSFDTENGDNIDRYRHGTGNYVKTDELELLSRKQAYLRACQVLLDDADGGKFMKDGSNWYGVYYKDTCLWGNWHTYTYHQGVIYFKNEDSLKKSLEEHKDQWEIVRKYEMGEE